MSDLHILCVNKEEVAVDGIAYLECGFCKWHVWIPQNAVDLTHFDVYQFIGDTHQSDPTFMTGLGGIRTVIDDG